MNNDATSADSLESAAVMEGGGTIRRNNNAAPKQNFVIHQVL
jgi:hypothetical protein